MRKDVLPLFFPGGLRPPGSPRHDPRKLGSRPRFSGALARAARAALPQPKRAWQLPGLRVRHLGPAQVRGVTPEGLPVVRLSDAWGTERVAEWALPYRYEPRIGDLLRVISQGERCYVIGVVQGRGNSRLAFQGNASIRTAGVLTLRCKGTLRLKAEEVGLRAAKRLEVGVREIQEKLGEATRVVKGLLEVRTQASWRVIEGEDHLVAGSVHVVGERQTLIDGKRIEIQ